MKKILILSTFAVILAGCFGRKSSELGPEQTVKEFYKALCSGEFESAESFCDTLSMREYIDGIREVWASADSAATVIVADILSGTLVEITGIQKGDGNRSVFYRLTAPSGAEKEAAAVLENEEGAWKIKTITDKR